MACHRCGWCCHELCVVLPDGTFKADSEQCKFLTWDGITAICTIYGKPTVVKDDEGTAVYKYEWNETPCGQYHSDDDIDFIASGMKCRMGEYISKHGGYAAFKEAGEKLASSHRRSDE